MKYTNVNIRFYNLNVENKLKHLNNFKSQINCQLIQYFDKKKINKDSLTMLRKKIVFKVNFQNSILRFSIKV